MLIFSTNLLVVSGCLTILSADDLELLDIPMVKGSKAPVKNVVYISEDSNPYAGENSTFSHQKTEAGRFNLFTGYQSPVQREKSFKVGTCNLKLLLLKYWIEIFFNSHE